MSRWLYTGDDPAVFPTLQKADGTTVFVKPGDVVELGDQQPAHRWLQPADKTAATSSPEKTTGSAEATPASSDAAAENAPQA